jgi:hypothetical protein
MRFHLWLLVILVVGCIAETRPRLGDSLDDNSSSGSSGDTTTEYTSDAKFYRNAFTDIVTINSNQNDLLYIRGGVVDSFLDTDSNFTGNYCVVINYRDLIVGGSAVNLQLRTRAVPISFNNISLGTTEKLFRLDLQDKAANQQSCKGTLALDNPTGSLPTSFTDATAEYLISEVCDQCLGIISTSEIFLYQTDGTNLTTKIPYTSATTAALDISDLNLQIDYDGNANNTQTGSCSNSVCQAQGFDCCLNSQCVNDGAQKPSASTSDANFVTALQEVLQNPNAYTSYPEYFYICAGFNNPPGDDPPADDPIVIANQNLAALIADKACIDELENVSQTDPYPLYYFNYTYPKGTYTASTVCELSDTTDDMYVIEVLTRLYDNCGCSETAINDKLNNCPAYTYEVLEIDGNGDPLSIGCKVPQPPSSPTPFQDLDVNVNSRSVAHRYFKQSDGSAVDDIEDLFLNTSVIYEGAAFSYLDGPNRMLPTNGDGVTASTGYFNMNSITGPFETTLDQALPAKVVEVDINTTYLIETRSGFYQPCLTCARDSWLNSFTAFPFANQGVGAKAIGHTTSRDQFKTNTTGGNYEDTKFSRACYIPPTMVPYSHQPLGDSITQRQARLKTQAALYMNGYQKDWFGFNRGAVIGSFDGVTWFAVGKGRLVTSTSTKLFLAINAPFGDLAQNSVHTVGVSQYTPPATASLYDYDPDLADAVPLQNEAGSCQKYHQCSTDSDCITQLGWEYMCADVAATKMYKPRFNAQAEENTNSLEISFNKWIFQSTLPGGTRKRCVYRGSGAPCKRDLSVFITNDQYRKFMTCAPNFYCADPGETKFNHEIVRYIGQLAGLPIGDGNLYGYDADVLGRQRHYVTSSEFVDIQTTAPDVFSNLNANMVLNNINDWGICRPGKYIPDSISFDIADVVNEVDPVFAHMNPDPSNRTDYISQIGAANADADGISRDVPSTGVDYFASYASCPAIDLDGEYLHTKGSFMNNWTAASSTATKVSALTALLQLVNVQNMSGSESKDTSGNSAFSDFEKSELGVSPIVAPGIAKNACLRRAGAVCHTDLDCGPNAFHADAVTNLGAAYFGNQAEQEYWEQSLICGQGEPLPQIIENDPNNSSDRFDLYDLRNNRCCREVGKDITIYSEDMDEFAFTSTPGFSTTNYSYAAPADPSRYSRLIVSGRTDGISAEAADYAGGLDWTIMTPDQWKTINRTATRTCCGGGWVRKFADGTIAWDRPDRVKLDVEDFKCINYKSPHLVEEDISTFLGNGAGGSPLISNSRRDNDRNYHCLNSTPQDSDTSSCAQVGMNSTGTGYESIAPFLDNNSTTQTVVWGSQVDRAITNYQSFGPYLLNQTNSRPSFFNPYDAISVIAHDQIDYDIDPAIGDDQESFVAYRLPSYMPAQFGADGILSISLVKSDSPTTSLTCEPRFFATPGNSSILPGSFNSSGGEDASCSWTTAAPAETTTATDCQYCYYPETGIIAIRMDPGYVPPGSGFIYHPRIVFTAPGSSRFQTNSALGNIFKERSQDPGNDLFYLKRLGKLELTGVPQMFHEPLYCSHNNAKLVPGIYNISDGTNANGVIDAEDVDESAFKIDNFNPALATAPFDTPNTRSVAPPVSPAQNSASTATFTDNGTLLTGDAIDHEPVFSGHEFRCCSKLGSQALNEADCCSAHMVADPTTGGNKCALPSGANLSVYFNRYISGEGIGTSEPGGGLNEDTDFDTHTGEPLLNASVYAVLSALGQEYCESGQVRGGAAFGRFAGEPTPFAGAQGNGVVSITDSINDNQAATGGNNATFGFNDFNNGFRWNHHLYCQ